VAGGLKGIEMNMQDKKRICKGSSALDGAAVFSNANQLNYDVPEEILSDSLKHFVLSKKGSSLLSEMDNLL
jgi:hypothetical protein